MYISLFLAIGAFITEPGYAQDSIDPILPEQNLLVSLYESAAPSVVNIQIVAPSQTQSEIQPESPFRLPIPGTPLGQPELPRGGVGSGFMYDEDGHILTNHHVIENAETIIVNFANGTWAEAEVVASDSHSDLAVLRVSAPEGVDWQVLPLAEEGQVRVGHYTAAIGNPYGLGETMTLGIVSAVGRGIRLEDGTTGSGYSLPDIIQTDTAVNPRIAGGPLLNLAGEVVGVNLAIEPASGSATGAGFAIPVSVVKRVVPRLLEDGTFSYAYLGISAQTVDAVVAQELALGNSVQGVLVGEVLAGGPSDEAGILSQDIIIAVEGQPIRRFEDLISYLFNEAEPDQVLAVELLREGESLELDVELAARPTESGSAQQEELGQEITAGRAISIARQAAINAGIIERVERLSAKRDIYFELPVWNVELTDSDGATVIVTIDMATGQVIEMSSSST